MMRVARAWLFAAAAVLSGIGQAAAQSTINVNVPATQSALTSLAMRQQFTAAASDINGLLGMHSAATISACPQPIPGQAGTPFVGTDCLVVGVSPYLWYKWTGISAGWALIGTLDPTVGGFIPTFGPQSANTLFAGPASGSAAAPGFRALVGADLPLPSSSTLGGTESITCSAGNNWVSAISTAGVPSCTGINPSLNLVAGTNISLSGTTTVTISTVTTPTFNTVTAAQIFGGTGVSSTLVLQATSNGSPSGSEAINILAHNVNINANGGGASTVIIGTGGTGAQLELYSLNGTGPQLWEVPSGGTGTINFPTTSTTLAGLAINQTWSGINTYNTPILFEGGVNTPGSNGIGEVGANSSNGLALIGQGSSNDFVLLTRSGAIICNVPASATGLGCTSLGLSTPLAIASGGTGQATAALAITALMPVAVRAGDIPYWNGSNWVTLAGNNSGTLILTENASGVPSWAATGSVSSVTIAGGGGNVASGTCTITTSGTCTVQAPGGFLNVLRNNSLAAWFHGCVASACTISPQFSVTAAVSNSGPCEITISSTATFTTGQLVPVSGIVGATGCNGTWVVTVTNGTQLTLQGSTFGGTYTSGGTAGGGFCAEGVFVIPTGAAVTCQQNNTSINSKPYFLMKITGNTSVTDVVVRFVIESYDIAYLSANNATFAAGILNNTGGTVTPTLQSKYSGGTQDSWSSSTIDLAATSLQSCTNGSNCNESYTLAVSNSANTGYELNLDLGNNFSSNAKNLSIYYFDFRKDNSASTGLNSSPPPPEFRDPESDIRWCERFFQTAFDNGVAPGSATTTGAWVTIPTAANTNTAGAGFGFRTAMRAAPSIVAYDGAGTAGKSSFMSSTGTFTNAQGGPNIPLNAVGQKGFGIFPPNGTNPLMFLWTADAAIYGG